MEEARYEYLATGKVAALVAMLSQDCTSSQPELIRKLENTPDVETRWARPWVDCGDNASGVDQGSVLKMATA
jgi:hypothetical protein